MYTMTDNPTENPPTVDWSTDYRGKTVVVSTHVTVDHIEQIREDLRGFVVPHDGRLRVNGFVLGKLVDVSIHGQLWVQFPWGDAPVNMSQSNVLKVLLDDEGEPEFVQGLPRMVP